MKCADCSLMDVRPGSMGPMMVCYVQRRTLGPVSEKNRERTCDAPHQDLKWELEAVGRAIRETAEDLEMFQSAATDLNMILAEKEAASA